MEPDGQLYACDHLINAEHRLGRLDEQTLAAAVDASVQLPFGQQKSLRRECQTCSVKMVCGAAARRISTPQATTASAEATTASLATSSHHYAPFPRP